MGKLLHKCSSFSNFRSDTFYWCFFKNEALQSINLVRKQVVCDTLISMFLCFFSTQKSYFRRHTTRNEGACIINRQRDHSCLKKNIKSSNTGTRRCWGQSSTREQFCFPKSVPFHSIFVIYTPSMLSERVSVSSCSEKETMCFVTR